MLRGVATINMDAKGRLAIPARFRKHLALCCEGHLVATIDYADPCLQVYPLPEWESLEHKLAALPSLDKGVRRLKRMLLGHATDCQMDSHSRILLPVKLRDFASLSKNTVIVGQGNKLELWDEKIWDDVRDKFLEEVDAMQTAALENLSI